MKSNQKYFSWENILQAYRVVSPRLLHGRHKREISGTEDSQEDGGHVHHLTVAWVLDDKDVLLDLKLNRDLLPESYREKYQHKVGADGFPFTGYRSAFLQFKNLNGLSVARDLYNQILQYQIWN